MTVGLGVPARLEQKPWWRVVAGKGKWYAHFTCLVCNIERNCSRNGLAKRLKQHWSCGFNPNL